MVQLHSRIGLGLLVLLGAMTSATAEVVLTAPNFKAVLSDQGRWVSLQNAAGRELCFAEAKLPLATVTTPQGSGNCTAVSLAGQRLTVRFGKLDTVLTYELRPTADWLEFKLVAIAGTRPAEVTLVQLPVALTQYVGRRLVGAWDDEQAVCLLAATPHPDCWAGSQAGKYTLVRATAKDAPGPKLEGAAVALVVAPSPALKPLLRRASHAFGSLLNEDAQGTPVKDTELPRGSYWFLSCGESDADRVIAYCRQANIKQVMLSSTAWCRSVGHYLFNQNYPDGPASLKRFVDKLHGAGILVGMHCFASKVSKVDPYVTPVPDQRFWVRFATTLAEDLSAEQTTIRAGTDLREWPGSPVTKQKYWEGGVSKHQEVIFGDEIIQYQSIGPAGKWDTFEGCRRGAWGTQAAAHKAGIAGRHYGVDGCINGYIIDQETSLLDEVTTRLTDIYNDCGFDMIYFDGGEDVDTRRFNYYVTNFQEAVMRKIKRRPIIHMGTIMTHRLWPSFARSSTVDTYLATLHGHLIAGGSGENWPTVRGHIDKSVRYMLSIKHDLMPGELGWFGIWPKQQGTDGLQLDELEYLMGKSLGYDAPISLQTSFGEMESHGLTPEILRIVAHYEKLRLERAVDEETCRRLQEMGQDFALIYYQGQRHFPEMRVLEEVGGGTEVRALVGEIPGAAVATLWHYLREGEITLPLRPERVTVVDFDGRPAPSGRSGDRLTLPVGPRRLALICPGLTADRLQRTLERAQVVNAPARRIIVEAESGKLVGEMALGSKLGLEEPQASGDFIVSTGRPHFDNPQEWYAEYTVNIPREGRWIFWARVRYPSGNDDSFGLVMPGQKLTLKWDQVLGNCGLNEKKWHWTGRGSGSTSAPPGVPIAHNLKAGPLTFRVYAREGAGTAAHNPRLDAIVLTDDPGEELSDALLPALAGK